ncbi:MAG: crossover junction endodeoxyribonuclease RuvC [bacterium]
MLIMGIDPGIRNTGIGVIKVDNKEKDKINIALIKLIETDSVLPDYKRLFMIYSNVCEIISNISPDVSAMENIYLDRIHPSSGLGIAYAKGAIIIALAKKDIKLYEYEPMEVKLAITGNGRASKEQVRKMIVDRLKIDTKTPHHICDALAVALCYIQRECSN